MSGRELTWTPVSGALAEGAFRDWYVSSVGALLKDADFDVEQDKRSNVTYWIDEAARVIAKDLGVASTKMLDFDLSNISRLSLRMDARPSETVDGPKEGTEHSMTLTADFRDGSPTRTIQRSFSEETKPLPRGTAMFAEDTELGRQAIRRLLSNIRTAKGGPPVEAPGSQGWLEPSNEIMSTVFEAAKEKSGIREDWPVSITSVPLAKSADAITMNLRTRAWDGQRNVENDYRGYLQQQDDGRWKSGYSTPEESVIMIAWQTLESRLLEPPPERSDLSYPFHPSHYFTEEQVDGLGFTFLDRRNMKDLLDRLNFTGVVKSNEADRISCSFEDVQFVSLDDCSALRMTIVGHCVDKHNNITSTERCPWQLRHEYPFKTLTNGTIACPSVRFCLDKAFKTSSSSESGPVHG